MGKIRVEYGASYAENASKNEKIGVCRGGARRKREDHARKQRPRKRCTLSWRGKRNESGAAVSSSAARDRAALAKSTERDRASRTESPESKHTPDAKKRSTPNPPENEWRVDTSSDKNGTNYGTYSAGMLTFVPPLHSFCRSADAQSEFFRLRERLRFVAVTHVCSFRRSAVLPTYRRGGSSRYRTFI